MLEVTSLLTYLYCPRKLFLEKILHLEKPFNLNLLIGTIKHDLMKRIVDALPMIVRSLTQEINLHDHLQKTYDKVLEEVLLFYNVDIIVHHLDTTPFRQELQEILTLELQFFEELITDNINQHHCYGDALWDVFSPQFRTEVYLASKNLSLKGKIDRLAVCSEMVVPYELKFSATAVLYETYTIQVGSYLLLLQDAGYPAAYGTVYFPTFHKKENITINPFLKHEIQQLITKVGALLLSKSLPSYCNNKAKCNSCEYRVRCYDEVFITDKLQLLGQSKDLNTT